MKLNCWFSKEQELAWPQQKHSSRKGLHLRVLTPHLLLILPFPLSSFSQTLLAYT